jgi:protein gp37/ParB-like chromosome segregation protein Spo0J
MDWSEILRHYDEISGIHPAADLFPMVEGDELLELCSDIKERGLQQPIVVWRDGTLLDGRNRLVACYRTNQEVVLETYEGDDPVQFSLSANLHRRHLNPGQRAVVALKLRALLQPAAKERQREAGEQFGKGAKVPADLREAIKAPQLSSGQPAVVAMAVDDEMRTQEADRKRRERETAAQAAKAVGARPRAVEQAVRVAKVAPDLLPQVQAGTMALDKAHREAQHRERQIAASRPAPEVPKLDEKQTITLLDHKGNPYEYLKPKGKATFNQQKGTEIGWAMWSWNPVTGCNHGCDYCYARAIATSRDMAAYFPAGFTPLFHHERLDAPLNTPVPARAAADPAHGRVFVCSMADLFGAWVPQEWIDQVVASTVANPQWEYLYLSKFPQRYDRLNLPASGWIGASVDEQHRAEPTLAAMRKVSGVKVKWLSLEPLLEPIKFSTLEGIDMIVIGAQSENIGQNSSFSPPFEWVADLVATARRDGCKVWLKTNLLGTVDGQWPGMKMPQEVPA